MYDVLQLLLRCVRILLFSVVTAVILQHHVHMDTHRSSSAPPRVAVVSGLVPQDDFVPSRLFREDGRDASKLAPGGGGTRMSILGAPTEAKQTTPGDPLQAQVEPVVPTYPKENKFILFRLWRPHA